MSSEKNVMFSIAMVAGFAIFKILHSQKQPANLFVKAMKTTVKEDKGHMLPLPNTC